MAQVTIIGLDLAKNGFQAHGASETGMVVFRKKLLATRFFRFSQSNRGVSLRWKHVRPHLAEHCVIAATNKSGLKKLSAMIEDETVGMPDKVRAIAHESPRFHRRPIASFHATISSTSHCA
jgi:hypothetical protein